MANNFRVFGQNTTNIRSDTEYINLNERINGFQPQTAISSLTMNTVLRQNSLISYAIAKMMFDGGYATVISPNSNTTSFQTAFENFMKGYFKKELGLDTVDNGSLGYWNGNKYVNIPLGNNGSALIIKNGIPSWSSDIAANTANYSQEAGKLKNFQNLSSGNLIKFTFGSAGSITTFEHEITVDIPGSVDSASNVTSTISGKLITAIFESNGTTVKNATLAESASNLSGGAAGSIPYQTASGSTSYLSKPATSSPYFLQMTNSGTPSWVLNANMSVGSATNAIFSNSLNMTSYNIGSIPYKNIQEQYGVILPPSSSNPSEEFVLVSSYSVAESGGQVPNWKPRQKITVVENSDGTVDVTITNV